MKYLSFDLEATGLAEHDLIIEFALVPFCAQTKTLAENLSKHWFIKCPSFEELKPNLDQWVIDHNKELIDKAHTEGTEIEQFKIELSEHLNTPEMKEYFNNQKIILFGKSMNAIDLPFMTRDLGWNYMRDHFHHQVLDMSSIAISFADKGLLPMKCKSGGGLMEHFNMGEVAHTALEDAKNVARLYFKSLES
jgi:oligoribonuclease (3'-5' exoribonuclease)